MKRRSFIFIILWLLAAALVPFAKADVPDISGYWTGAIDIPSMKLEVNIDFTKENGAWKGTISIPAQDAKNLPLENIRIEGEQVSFGIANIPGKPAFTGTFSENGTKITGTFTQNGKNFPFTLEREPSPAEKAKKALKGFEEVVKKGLEGLQVPGAAMAVVVGNEVIFSSGFGYRDLENKLPMTPDTLLAIGSASKAFTTFAMGTLVDKDKMEWNTPVRQYIPWFKLYDPFASEHLTPRDLVTHRSGLPRHDLVWYNNFTDSREKLVRRLAYLQPTADLRERFQYNNLMFLTAGYLVETLTGKPWEDSIRALVLEPLNMKRTNFSVKDSQKDADFALPYNVRDNKIEKIPFRNITTVGPAGSINSSVNEMSHWLLVHLNQGKYQDQEIINAQTLQDMHLAHMPTGNTPAQAEVTPAVYGLGWFIDTYQGHPRVHHGGNIDGFSALVSMFPKDGIGFVVLTNMNGTGLPELLVRQAADRILGFEQKDWIDIAIKQREQGREVDKEAREKRDARRIKGTKLSHAIEEYAGDYEHPGYGTLKVFLKNGKLGITFNGITASLEHWHYATFNGMRIDDPTFENMKLTFHTDMNGYVTYLTAPFEATLAEIRFDRKPDSRLFDPEYLKKFEGNYSLMEQTLKVSLKGNTLTLYIPGQPEYNLVPGLGDEFMLDRAKIVRVRFLKDEKGQVTAVELDQPGGIYEAKKTIG